MNQESAEAIDDAAFTWLARLDREGGSAALEAELNAWLAADPRHRGAYLRAEAIWSKLDRASLADRNGGATPEWTISRRALVAAGGSAIAAGAAGVWFAPREETLSTAVGEVRHVVLADRSTVVVNTKSLLHVAMRRDLRRIELTQGEAWFRVEKDAERPFVVEAGRVRVRAVGTAFSVRRLQNGADIYVTEGVVEAWIAGQETSRARIAAGQIARVVESEVAVIQPRSGEGAEIDRKLAWRAGQIELAGETLGEAVADFNRYNARKLRLTSSALAAKRLYGVFRTDDPEGFARTAAVVLGAHVEAAPEEIIIGDA